jgi:hypothetical protein
MNVKWCVSTLIIVLAVFGLSQGPTKASNQQIVFQFTDVALASERAHDQVLAAIIQKLRALGINTIEVVESTVAEVPEFSEWFIPVVRYTSPGEWYPCGILCRTKIDAEGHLRTNVSTAADWRIVRVLLPNTNNGGVA